MFKRFMDWIFGSKRQPLDWCCWRCGARHWSLNQKTRNWNCVCCGAPWIKRLNRSRTDRSIHTLESRNSQEAGEE